MTTQEDIKPPIILIVGARPQELEELVGHNNDFTRQIFGTRPSFLRLGSKEKVLNFFSDIFLSLLHDESDKSFGEIKAWVATDDFVQFATERLPDSDSDGFKWALAQRQHVRLIVLDMDELSQQDLLQSIFPNALVQVGGLTLSLSEILIEDLELSVRAYNALKRKGVQTVQDLIEMSQAQAGAIPGMGKKAMDEVKEALQVRGLGLRKE